jgi:hypothetical protein
MSRLAMKEGVRVVETGLARSLMNEWVLDLFLYHAVTQRPHGAATRTQDFFVRD